MNVHFYATLRDITRTKVVDFDLPERVTVRELVDAMTARFPPLREKLLQDSGDLWGHVHIFINGRDVRFLDGQMDAQVSSSDTVSIFPAVGGGSAV